MVAADARVLVTVVAIAVMGGLPAWPLTAALFLTTSTIFAAVYQVLFSDFLCGATPGKRLAMLASAQPDLEGEDPRFR